MSTGHRPGPAERFALEVAGRDRIWVSVHSPNVEVRRARHVWLQHGFGRSAHHLASLAACLAGDGNLVLAPSLPSALLPLRLPRPFRHTAGQRGLSVNNLTGNRPLLDELAAALANEVGPVARAASRDAAADGGLVLIGHSAGADAVAWIAGALTATWSRPPAALILVDPVPSPTGDNLVAGLRRAAGVPVRIVAAAPGRCNRNGLGTQLALSARPDASGFQLRTGSHADVEGVTSDHLARVLCGVPQPGNVAATRALIRTWVRVPDVALRQLHAHPELSGLFATGDITGIGDL
jgi:hypothetical protein